MNSLEILKQQDKSEFIILVTSHLSHLTDLNEEEMNKIAASLYREEEEERKSCQLHSKNSQTKYFTSSVSTSSNSNHHDKSSTSTSTKFGPPKEKELASNIFGNPLSHESLRQAMILVDYLNEDQNYKLEGIFRKSGTQQRQQELRYMLNNGARVDLKANRFTAVDTSCVLKEFIQKLPEPLLTNNHFELHYELAKAIKNETRPDELEAKNIKRLKIVQLLLHLMPELNRNFFMSLMALLNKVAQAVDVTKMGERSLATIFGQHILCPRTWTPKQVQKNIAFITDAMEFLLENYEKLFNGPEELVLDAKIKLKKYQAIPQSNQLVAGGDSITTSTSIDDLEVDENKSVVTFCQRSQETRTEQALAELYAQVQAMPETPAKKKLIKQFNRQNGIGTPMQVTGRKPSTSSSKWTGFLDILRPKH